MGIRIRSLPAALSKRTVRLAAATGALVIAAVPGATAASAAVAHPNETETSSYRCTSNYLELCFGIYYSGHHVGYAQVQVDAESSSSHIYYTVSSPYTSGPVATETISYSGSGWAKPFDVPINNWYSTGDTFCGTATVHGIWNGACLSLS